MRGIIICFFLTVLNLVFCQNQESTTPPEFPTSTRDPYANVMSQLSDVIFDVEDRLYRLTNPKQESDNLKALSGKPLDNRRRNYFDQIRDNYKTLQDQLGQTLNSGGMIKMGEILNLNFQNKGARSSLDLSLPFLPLSIQVDSKRPPLKEAGKKFDKNSATQYSPLSDASSNVNLDLGGIFGQQTPRQPVEKQNYIQPELQKRSSRPSRSELNRKDKKKSSSEAHIDYSKPDIEHSVDNENESGVEGRILGDLLFSESTYDKYFRKALNDHGKWLLDSAISPPKKIIESIRDVTRNQFSSAVSPKSTPMKGKSSMKSSGSKKDHGHPQGHPQVHPHHGHPQGHPQGHPHHGHHQAGSWKHDPHGIIVLAFTPEGLPLKLKIDRSVHRPLKFLHRILAEERLYLNVPVSTTNGVKHVGNDVLQLGFKDDMMSSRTPVIDMSDHEQLHYLLRTLKKLRYENH